MAVINPAVPSRPAGRRGTGRGLLAGCAPAVSPAGRTRPGGRRAAGGALLAGCLAVAPTAGCTRLHLSLPSVSFRARSGAEQAYPPAPGWRLGRRGRPDAVQGWAAPQSVTPGEVVGLHVATSARRFRVRVFRMGWYAGVGAGLVFTSAWHRATPQPPPEVVGPRHTVLTRWTPNAELDTAGWRPGAYLLRLEADDGAERFVPLTVRAPATRGTVVLVAPVTTWQAYNAWGGYSLYHGPGGKDDAADRSRAVSFDRPYAGDGAGEFLGRELPVVSLAERLGLRLSYLTDVDLHADAHALDGARAVVFMAHDEYWSPQMRRAVEAARDAGANVAFLGANAVFRRVRFEPGDLGPDRVEVNYKSAAEDPVAGLAGAAQEQVTADWPYPPAADPESALTGTMYDCFPARAPLVVVDPDNWLFARTGVRAGTALANVVGPESDRVNLRYPTPHPIEVLAHSPLSCKGHLTASDVAYYTTASGAGVFDAGTIDWVCALADRCRPRTGPQAARVLGQVTANLLSAFAAGPAGQVHPAEENLAEIGIGASSGPY